MDKKEDIQLEINTNVEDDEKETIREFDIGASKDNEVVEVFVNDDKKENVETTKTNNKKLYIILGVVAVILVIVIIILIVALNKKDNKTNTETEPSVKEEENNVVVPSDEECQKIINEYGNKLTVYIRDYIAEGYDVAGIKSETMVNLLPSYEVRCELFELDNNGNITLNNCSINGSAAIYNYKKTYSAPKPDTDFEISSVDGKLTFYYDGLSISTNEEEDCQKYTINCEEESCVLDTAYAYYAIIKEKSGKSRVFNFYNNQKIYTVLAGYEVGIIAKYDENYEEEVFALFLRNPENQEALYSLDKGKIVIDYGIYTYDWEDESSYFTTPVIDDYIPIYANKKAGLLRADTFEAILEPTEYDYVTTYYDYIYVEKGNYMGLLQHNTTTNEVETIIKPNKYEDIFYDDEYILVKKSGKYGVLDKTGKTQYLGGKFYDAIAFANYNNGGALVLDGNILKVLDLNGNLLKSLGELPKGMTISHDYEMSGYGEYKDDDDNINVWLKFINPNYDENANDKYYDCVNACDSSLEDDEFIACEKSCEPYYQAESSHDCVEYNYNFATSKLDLIPMECEGGYAKPVLYLYPTLPVFVNITFDNPEKLTTTYPKYEGSWNVLANANGDLYDSKGNYYYALYWEEESNHRVDFNEGFYVTKENAIEFLEEKLTEIGLNSRERNEFIMYWLPILEKNGQSLVYFELTEERNHYSKININPEPDSLLRLAIHIKKVDSYTKIREQKLPAFKRKGFTVVEWGGVLY